jgi:predicted class III extradiol MEMO1 family dioxygenase
VIFQKISLPLITILTASCLLTGCPPEPEYSYRTWDSRGKTFPDYQLPLPEETVPEDCFPVAGIVSHHLLAGVYIDEWFRTLSEQRDVGTFIIITPDHWGMGTQEFSLADSGWQAADGIVPVNTRMTRQICRALNVHPDPEAFTYEHGVSTLIPFLHKYFPKADIVAVSCPGEPPVDQPRAERLRQAIAPHLTGRNSRRNFLIISSDFSHHRSFEETAETDLRSRKFLSAPGPDTWIFAGCDNRPGMYILGSLSGGMDNPDMTVLYHTDSFTLSGQIPEDITSYFFTFLGEREP